MTSVRLSENENLSIPTRLWRLPAAYSMRRVNRRFCFAYCVSLVCVAAVGLVLSWYNRAPLVFHDTFFYFHDAHFGIVNKSRPTMYAPLMYALFGARIWVWLAVQSLAISFVLHELTFFFFRHRARRYLLITPALCLLSLLTPINFESSYLMPDFSGALLLVLASIMLAGWRNLSLIRKTVYSFLSFLFASFHLSHFPMLLGLVAVAVLISFAGRRFGRDILFPAGILLAVVVVGLSLVSIQNKRYLNTWSPTPMRDLFLFARFYEAGPVKDYLEETCRSKTQDNDLMRSACRANETLAQSRWSAQRILWTPRSPMRAYGNHVRKNQIAREVVSRAIRKYPFRFLFAFVSKSFEQFNHIGLEDAVLFRLQSNPQFTLVWLHRKIIGKTFEDYQHVILKGSRQEKWDLPVANLNAIYLAEYYGGMVFLLLMMRRRGSNSELVMYCSLIFVGLVLNAGVCGGLSALDGRYQLRVSWLPFCSAVFACLSLFGGTSRLREAKARLVS